MIIRKERRLTLCQWNSFTMTFIRQKKQDSRLLAGSVVCIYKSYGTGRIDAKDLFVLEDAGKFLGAARINKAQVDSYAEGDWEFAARDEEVCVFTLW